MKRFLIPLLLVSVSAIAGFYPVNRGMINQASVTTVAGTTTTFVATSNQVRIAEGGTAGETFKFPDATLLPVDWWYSIINNSSGTVTASDNAGSSITTIAAGQPAYFQLTAHATAAGTWKYNVQAVPSNIISDHGSLTGLGDDDHPQYHNDARGDVRYYTKTEHINASAGASDAGKPIVLNASGVVDSTMLPGGGGITAIGQYDFGSPSNDGATVSGSSILLQSASSSVPGMMNITAQSFLGLKNFLDSVKLPTVTASQPLKTDANGVVTSSPIILSSADVEGLLPNANLANDSITVNGTTCTLGSSCTPSGGGGGSSPTSIGTIDSQTKSADGLVTSSTVLYAQTADASFPGMVSTTTQSFKGDKTILDRLNIATVTASRPLKSDVSGYVTSSQIILSSTNDVVGTLGVANGGTGNTSYTDGQLLIGNTSTGGLTKASLTAGSGITITNGAGAITVSTSSSALSQALFSGYHAGDCFWSTTSTTYVDPADDGSCTFTTLLNDGMGTVSTTTTNKPGVIISSPPYTGTMEVCATVAAEPATADSLDFALTDGTNNVLGYTPTIYGTASNIRNGHVCGFKTVTASTSVTFKVRIRTGAGFTGAIDGNGQDSAVSWTVKYVK